MGKRKSADSPSLDELIDQFIEVSGEVAPLNKLKKTLSTSIKKLLGDKEEYETEVGTVTYKYDEDGEKEVVDMLMLKEKFPKVYEKVVTKEKVPGKRRLLMPGSASEEE